MEGDSNSAQRPRVSLEQVETSLACQIQLHYRHLKIIKITSKSLK